MMHGRRDARLELASLVCMAYGLCICGVVPGSLAVSPFTQETPTQLPVPTRTETPTPLPAPTRTHKPMVATTPAAHRVATRPTPMHLPTAAPHAPIEMRQDATKITLSAAVNPVAECPLGRGKCSVFEFQGDVTLLAPGAQRIIAYAASVETPFGQIWHRTISQCHGDAQSIVVDIGANHGTHVTHVHARVYVHAVHLSTHMSTRTCIGHGIRCRFVWDLGGEARVPSLYVRTAAGLPPAHPAREFCRRQIWLRRARGLVVGRLELLLRSCSGNR